ncbi:MAG: hypothetical protein WC648_00860 [Candidatus Paceibacterota bacterium]|jgi:outer membrane lipoprotein SlyB
MNPKHLIWIGVIIGGMIGGYIPTVFGSDSLSIATIIGNTIGGLIGLWAGFKLSQNMF